MTTFDDALAFVLAREGCDLAHGDTGYVNNANDPGGATNYGITQETYNRARAAAGESVQSVRDISYDEVGTIYRRDYWNAAHCQDFADPHPKLALVHFDCAVNMGLHQAALCLQRALGVTVDGIVGPETIAAAIGCAEAETVSAYLVDRARIYRQIVEGRPASAVFLKGWLARLRWCARAAGVPIDPSFA